MPNLQIAVKHAVQFACSPHRQMGAYEKATSMLVSLIPISQPLKRSKAHHTGNAPAYRPWPVSAPF